VRAAISGSCTRPPSDEGLSVGTPRRDAPKVGRARRTPMF
jgi:hypothetical protein